jgi:hypothetical protein
MIGQKRRCSGGESVTELKFKPGQATVDELQEVIDDVLAALQDPDSEASAAAQKAGIARDDVIELGVTAREDKPGFVLEAILIAFATGAGGGAGKQLANRMWDKVLWPAIKRSPLGGKAVGDKAEDDKAEDDRAEGDKE